MRRVVVGRGRLPAGGLVADAAVAASAMVIAVAQQATSTSQTPQTRTVGLTLAALYPLALVVRRRAPVWVMVGMLAGLVAWSAAGVSTSGAGIPLVVALYTVAAYRPGRVSLPVLGLTIATLGAVATIEETVALSIVEVVATFTAAWWLGDNARTRRAQSEALEAYAAELADTREALAERRVAEERLRIAREMHDVVAHSLGVVAIQAGVAEHILDDDPALARRSVTTIGDVARSSLADMRRMLGLLRGDEAPQEASAPRLTDVPRLVAEIGDAAELDVRLQTSGERPAVLDPALELSAYRVVQEALTNAGKHAPGSQVSVALAYGRDDVRVEVCDDGGTAPARDVPGSGNGLIGMRERVGMFGGTLEADRMATGGFRVVARFPLVVAS